MKIGRGVEFADEIPAEVAVVVINEDGFHIIHIQAQRVTEQNNEDKRNGKSQIKAAVITDQVIKFLADDGLESDELHALSLFMILINASVRSASAAPGQAPAIMSAGVPAATISPSLIITIRSQKRASSM